MIKTIQKNWFYFLPGALVGAISGYFYWKYFGCTGTCMITSSPVRSIIYFGAMGLLVNQMFKPTKKRTKKKLLKVK